MSPRLLAALGAASILLAASPEAQTTAQHGKRVGRLIIRNALVVDGTGTPTTGPWDIVIENNRIAALVPIADATAATLGQAPPRPTGDAYIDAKGKYVLPGLINAHAHVQDERGGIAQDQDYELKIWLASGITSVRDVGSDTRKTLPLREKIAAGTVAGPRLFHYPFFSMPNGGPFTPAEARERVRALKAAGVDGIKIVNTKRDIMEAMEDEAHKVGLRVAHHAHVEETNAWDDIRFGTTTIEHWYGVPDAAILDRVQHFPSTYNLTDETDRFRYAGRLWREADPARLTEVLQGMVKAGIIWVPTLNIYEASRDLQRAQATPWFKDYLHPALEEFFKPNPMNHGSYFIGWTSTDEAYWKENYQLWFKALREFDRMGGTIAAGDDAGFIYQMYGWGLIRELELKQEAGFHPLRIIQQATSNGAKVLGREGDLGAVRVGWLADLIVVNGNPLENLKVLYPSGTEAVKDGKVVPSGGVEWTIKDGIPYHGPTLLKDVKAIVDKARAARGKA